MAIARITVQGLTSIAILVFLLWACAIGELVIVRNANADTLQALRDMRVLRLKKLRPPVSAPLPAHHPVRPRLG